MSTYLDLPLHDSQKQQFGTQSASYSAKSFSL